MNTKDFFGRSRIPFTVFITGACVLVIEVTATRVLAPYFGNTIFSISSVISVVLAALALGYYAGGRLADIHPSEKLFYGIVMASGVCVIFLHVAGILFLISFGYKLSLMQGPIISSIVLFFLQSFLLGMLSPFAIKLQAVKAQTSGIGSISGGIFFWSTVGSIFGSLLAGFYLIPTFGINIIILGTGFLLISIGAFFILSIPLAVRIGLAVILIVISFSLVQSLKGVHSGIYSQDGVYQKITILQGTYNGKPARFLMQDRNSSAAAYINSDDLVYEYTKYYALYQIFRPDAKEALAIGGGAYSVPKSLLHDSPDIHVDVAEIEPSLFDLGKQYFNVPDTPRLINRIEDGRRLLYDSDKKYDMMFSDAYASFYSTPEHLTTREFFQIAKNRLSDNGVFIANVIGGLHASGSTLLFSEMRTFREVFPNCYFFAVRGLDDKEPQNVILVGYKSNRVVNMDDASIRANKNPIIANLASKQINIDDLNLGQYPVLTDDFSPVEYMTARELQQLHY